MAGQIKNKSNNENKVNLQYQFWKIVDAFTSYLFSKYSLPSLPSLYLYQCSPHILSIPLPPLLTLLFFIMITLHLILLAILTLPLPCSPFFLSTFTFFLISFLLFYTNISFLTFLLFSFFTPLRYLFSLLDFFHLFFFIILTN